MTVSLTRLTTPNPASVLPHHFPFAWLRISIPHVLLTSSLRKIDKLISAPTILYHPYILALLIFLFVIQRCFKREFILYLYLVLYSRLLALWQNWTSNLAIAMLPGSPLPPGTLLHLVTNLTSQKYPENMPQIGRKLLKKNKWPCSDLYPVWINSAEWTSHLNIVPFTSWIIF